MAVLYAKQQEINDPHCVAGLLKQYVRLLPGGLVCGKATTRFIGAASAYLSLPTYVVLENTQSFSMQVCAMRA